MELAEIEIFIMENPPPGYGGRYFTFVKLTSKDGITGWGEAYAASIGPQAMRAVIGDVFSRYFAGRDPHEIERLYRSVYSSGFTQRPDLTVMGAFSALEIACWDMLGKARNLPIWAMLGGQIHENLRVYSYLYPKKGEEAASFYNDADLSAARAGELADLGFTAIKFDPAGPYTIMGGHQPSMRDLERSVAFCKAIREAVGDRADILFGTHGQFTTSGAIRMARAIEPYSPLWFEEPCPPDNILEFGSVARATTIPIATGERLTGKSEFAMLLRSGGASILQPALGRVGGIWEAKKIAAMAEGFNAQIAPHLYAGPIEWLANLHLASSCPNFLIAETIFSEQAIHAQLINPQIDVEEGHIRLPDAPGLGVEIDEEFIRAHPYDGKRLHLEMQASPHDYTKPSGFAGG